ncbi:MAG: hypothetical protein ACP5I3_11365 [Thermoproteus sp.]
MNIVRRCRSLLSYDELLRRFEVEADDRRVIYRGGVAVVVYRTGAAIAAGLGSPPEWLEGCTVVNVVGMVELPPMSEARLIEIAERSGLTID